MSSIKKSSKKIKSSTKKSSKGNKKLTKKEKENLDEKLLCTSDGEINERDNDDIMKYMYDESGKYMGKRLIKWYEVIAYSAKKPKRDKNDQCMMKDINHVVIGFFDDHQAYWFFDWGQYRYEYPDEDDEKKTSKRRQDTGYIIEWPTVDKDGWETNPDEFWGYKGRSWFGCRIKVDRVTHPTSIYEAFLHAKQWINKIGKGGSYPKNCRGYVDSALKCLLHEPVINWTKYGYSC